MQELRWSRLQSQRQKSALTHLPLISFSATGETRTCFRKIGLHCSKFHYAFLEHNAELHCMQRRGGSRQFTIQPSTARTKHAIGRFDFHFTLRARCEPECAARRLNDRAAGTFTWILHKLVESNLRRRSNIQV